MSVRHYVRVIPAVLFFLSGFVHYFARVSINVAILNMAAGDQRDREACADRDTSDSVFSPSAGRDVFCWTGHQQSLVKGMFYYGYIFLQLPGGRLSEIYGTRRVLGFATVLVGLLTLVSPLAAGLGAWYLIALRFCIGFFQGVLFPSKNPMVIRWVSKEEFGRFKAFASMGGTLGTVLIYPLTGYIATEVGWEAVFYVSGACALVWCVLWFLLVTDDPADHPFMTEKELEVIRADPVIPERTGSLKVPFWRIMTSRAVWALLITSLASDYGLYMLLTEGPNFLKNALKKDLTQVGILSSFPYLGRFTFAQLSGRLTDYLIVRPHLISLPNLRRMNYVIALMGPALGLAAMGYLAGDDVWIYCIAVQTIAFCLNGFVIPAWLYVMDIGPSFTGTVPGIANGMSSVTGFLVPFIAAAFVSSDPSDPANWRYLFFSATGAYSVAAVAFCAMAKFEPEPFNFDEGSKKGEEEGDEKKEEETKC